MKTLIISAALATAMATSAGAVGCNSTSTGAAGFDYTACEGLRLDVNGSSGNDSVEGFNSVELFDFDDWTFVGKYDVGGSYTTGSYDETDFSLTGGESGATFSISETLWEAYDALAFVVKAGSLNSTEYPLVAYLLEDNTAGGTIGMPILSDGKKPKARDNSHYSLYGVKADDDNIAVTPLPAAGWMLIAGLAGLGYVSRKRAA